MARLKPLKLHLISTLRHEAAFWLPYEGESRGRGAPRQYGNPGNYPDIPNCYRKPSEVTQGIWTDSYPIKARPNRVASPLNVVITRTTNLTTGKTAQVVLVSTALELTGDKPVDYYRWRLQLELNCRDAKPDGGLDDLMNIGPLQVANAAKLSRVRVKLS